MRTLNPTVKLFAILGLALLVSFQNNFRLNLLLCVLFFAVSVSERTLKKSLLLVSALTLAAVGVFFTGLLYYQDNQSGSSSAAAMRYGLDMASRIYCFGMLGSSFSVSTTINELIYSLQQQLRLPAVFAYGLLAAFQIAPIIPAEYQNIRNSMRSRGIPVNPFSFKMLIPLLVKSIRWSELLATAMLSRGFDSEAKRTYAKSFRITFADMLFLSFCLIIGLAGTLLL
ncbi:MULTISPECIES: energy-coupling factor transporter transmembrane component T [Enterococcus]|jgi:energy-coupling factor transport system permease protein|uniref:energy-coupling factor transporter transmembrane component T n=1 Tax=Enterococcus TaxID=1350 RepID=UPI0001B6C14D|nr:MULTISPECIES: energy-coupling factor transporter transmembrane component T [Enterococcus]ATF73223.1 energy-coupling factor transporter transmembrane protein EcfT [Enterococcus sp. FDAARGOS_375]MDK4450442.1 energy-coupling factor transporter transmembrane protein EcfT [Enterococcus casseliflavus]MEB8416985.1 energy-coupling factor transporter transmembrane protein EcfT [Enterococcus casseliflavus]HAB98092.1 energy-coupling factor transporter transmembrane protein EcfT [Enterococcus sp.]